MKPSKSTPLPRIRFLRLPLAILTGLAVLQCKPQAPTKEAETVDGTILAVQPSTLETGSRLSLSIVGKGTHFADSIWLRKGEMSIPGHKEAGSETSMVAAFIIPLDAPTGPWDLVMAEAGQRKTLVKSKAVTLLPTTVWIDQVSPGSIDLPGLVTLRITGHNTGFPELPEAGWLRAGEDSVPASGFYMGNPGTVVAQFSLPMKTSQTQWNLYLQLRYRTISKENALDYHPRQASISSVAPDSAERMSTISVVLTGVATRFTSGTNTLWLERGSDTIRALSSHPYNDSLLGAVFHIPADAAVGAWNLKLYQPWYLLSHPSFRITEVGAPRITALEPTSGARGANLEVSLSGERVTFYQGTATSVEFWLRKGTDSLFGGSGNYRFVTGGRADRISWRI
ncbi:MAG: hypothetical protein M3Y08_17220, partial [Fibrobacterota bacterium]|nr:hypothetical protein [Fibrobacterota bacterium]